MKYSGKILHGILASQKNEITEFEAYTMLSRWTKNKTDRNLFNQMKENEMLHYRYWKELSGRDVKPNLLRAKVYVLIVKYLGTNFGIKLMENDKYQVRSFLKVLKKNHDAKILMMIKKDTSREIKIVDSLDKSGLSYTSSIILGLNDALVELTGSLAGFTLAFQNPHTIAVAGFIVGVAASFSMGASEYLSTKEEGGKNPLKASLYTGFTYLITVFFLITPFFIFNIPLVSMGITLFVAISLICIFNFYISVAKRESFRARAGEMIAISLGVAILNFCIGFLAKKYLHLEI